MNILVTGGCGFIGSHFVKRLYNEGHDVWVLDKLTYAGNKANLKGYNIPIYIGDITSSSAVEAAANGADAIVNFAAESHVDNSIKSSRKFIETNILGTQTLLDYVKNNKHIWFVQVSTDEVYGDVKEGSSKETDALNPSSPYSASKAAADMLVLSYVRTHNITASITRGANTYGPNQYPEKLIPVAIKQAVAGNKIPIYGDGEQIREWLYVQDHVSAIYNVLKHGRTGEVYNIGGEPQKNIEIVKMILDHLKSKSGYGFVHDRPGHDLRYSVDSVKIQNELLWSRAFSLSDMLPKTIDWYIENKAWWL